MKTLLRWFQIWRAEWRYSVSRDLQFRGNFLLWMLVEVAWFVLQLAFVQVLFLHTDDVAGWTKPQMILLVGISQLIQQLFQTFFLVNFINFPEIVRDGKLDFPLLQPAPVLLLVTTRIWDIGSVFNCCFALAVCAWAIVTGHLPLHLWGIAGAGLLVLCGVGLHYACLLLLVTPVFWMTRAQGFVMVYYQAFQLARQPREVYRGLLRFAFSWIIPLLLVANLPVRALTGGFHWSQAAALVAITAALLLVAFAAFRHGLRHYTSASS